MKTKLLRTSKIAAMGVLMTLLAPMTSHVIAQQKTDARPAATDPVSVIWEIWKDGAEDVQDARVVRSSEPAASEIVPDFVVENGYRRVIRTDRLPLSPERLAELQADGKDFTVDRDTGELIVETFRDYLPENWRRWAEPGELVDSYGNPIVNVTPGLPDWAQRDVDALRDTIAEYMLVDGQAPDVERELALGNFIGQAVVRGIPVGDTVDILDGATVTANVAASIIDYLHFYENLKYIRSLDGTYEYVRSIYGDGIARFVAAHGVSLDEILELDDPDQGGGPRSTPSGCYTNTTFTRGMTNLTGATVIWDGSVGTYDDSSSDVPIGFNFQFYACDDATNRTQVRVGTNGYFSFYEQGGGAIDGTDYTNDAITSTTDPDGYATPWWDDMQVENQGSTDKVSYITEGSTGSRVFTVEWYSLTRRGGDTGDYHYYQVKLFEAGGKVELHYGIWTADSSDSATVGLEDYDGGDGDCGPNCGSTNSSQPPSNYRYVLPGDDCSNAQDLGSLTSPYSATTTGYANDYSVCSMGSSPDRVFYIDVPNGYEIEIWQSWNNYDSRHTMRYSGACPGSTEIGCIDDSDYTPISWTNSTGATERVWWINAGYSSYSGDFTLEWTLAATGTPGLWTGATSTDWNTGSNWDDGNVPTNTVDVVIPSGCNYYPDLGGNTLYINSSGTYACQSLDVQSGGSITGIYVLYPYGTCKISGGTLTAQYSDVYSGGNIWITSGTCNITGNGPWFHTGSTLTMSGGSVDSGSHIQFQSGSTEAIGNGSIYLAGDFTASGGNFTPTGGTVTFDGGSASSISGSPTFYDLVIAKSTAATQVSASADMGCYRMYINSGTFNANGYTTTVSGPSSLGAAITLGDASGSNDAFLALGSGTVDVTADVSDIKALYIRSDGQFNLSGGTFNRVITRSDDYYLCLHVESGGVYNQTSGTFNLDNQTAGFWWGITVDAGGDFNMSGGNFYNDNTTYCNGVMDFDGGTYYVTTSASESSGEFSVAGGGRIEARNTTFTRFGSSGTAGINVYSGAQVGTGTGDDSDDFDGCTFTDGTSGGRLLTLSNSETFSATGTVWTLGSATYNVYKTNDSGSVSVCGATGSGTGAAYENDPYGRVHWDPVSPASASSNRDNFCADDIGSIDLSVSGGSGSTVRWFDDSCDGNDIGTGSPLTIASPTSTTTYYARWENTCGNSSCASVTVTVTPLPADPGATGASRCGPGTVDLTASGSTGNYRWWDASTGGTMVGTGSPWTTPYLTTTTTYYVEAATTGGTPSSLTTTFAGGSGHAGNMYDLTILNPAGIVIDSFDVNLDSGTWDMEVYFRTAHDSYVGHNTDPTGWTLMGSATGIVSNGSGVATPLPIGGPEVFADGETVGFYVTVTNGTSINYTNGPLGAFENADLRFEDYGHGGEYPFNLTYTPRIWNGTVYYTAGSGPTCASARVPATATINPLPATPTNAIATPSSICDGESSTLSASVSGAVIDWYEGSCSGTPFHTGDSVSVSPTSTTTYYAAARVSSTGCESTGCDSVQVVVEYAPANDNIALATLVNPGTWPYTDTVLAKCATTEGGDPSLSCGAGGQQEHSVWYVFGPVACDGTIDVETCGSDYDTVLAVWRDDGSLTEVACNDDELLGECGGGTVQSALSVSVDEGETYYIEVVRYSTGAAGTLEFWMDYAQDLPKIRTTVDLQGVDTAIARTVTFIVTDCDSTSQQFDLAVSVGSDGVGSIELMDVDPNADWIWAKEGHTLSRRMQLGAFDSCNATSISFTTASYELRAGDFYTATAVQDDLVDVLDFAILATRWEQPGDPADATGNGFQDGWDFAAIQSNFFEVGDSVDGCGSRALGFGGGLAEGPRAAIAVADLALDDADLADRNGDGVVDCDDIYIFAEQHGLEILPSFELKVEQLRATGVIEAAPAHSESW